MYVKSNELCKLQTNAFGIAQKDFIDNTLYIIKNMIKKINE